VPLHYEVIENRYAPHLRYMICTGSYGRTSASACDSRESDVRQYANLWQVPSAFSTGHFATLAAVLQRTHPGNICKVWVAIGGHDGCSGQEGRGPSNTGLVCLGLKSRKIDARGGGIHVRANGSGNPFKPTHARNVSSPPELHRKRRRCVFPNRSRRVTRQIHQIPRALRCSMPFSCHQNSHSLETPRARAYM
jgi:hypothetical protein